MPAFVTRRLLSGAIDQNAHCKRRGECTASTPRAEAEAAVINPTSRTPQVSQAEERIACHCPTSRPPNSSARFHLAVESKPEKRFDREDVLRFTAEMSVLLKAGLPLDEQ